MCESYWTLVRRRAVTETRGVLSLTKGFIVRTLLVSVAGVVLSWKYRPLDATVNTVWTVVMGVIVANVLVAVVMFLVQIIRAPGLIHRDNIIECERLRACLIEAEALLHAKKQNLGLVNRLVALRKYGLHSIRNEFETDPAHIKRYLKREEEWKAEVESELRANNCPEREISGFSDVTNSEIGLHGAHAVSRYGPDGGFLIGVMEMRLRRLSRIIDLYSGDKLFEE